ncbi:MAG TPA: TlpA disulfide reductase family protein [Sedimentisphaerales bacterium]|nr:TlpA disulfide reductase family protein [Sedimentisphaerales bacterium]
MVEHNKQTGNWLAVAVCAVLLAAATIDAGCKKKPVQQAIPNQNDSNVAPDVSWTVGAPAKPNEPITIKTTEPPEPNGPAVNAGEPTKPKKTDAEPASAPRLSLSDVIRAARGWGPIYQAWYGKPAPDFTLTDITGKQHKLSDYRGKNVMLVFWATWCRPCLIEIPHLIALQNVMGKDKLAILAVSYISPINTAEMVRSFVQENERINYTVFSTDDRTMPAPYNAIEGIPSSFFINPEGRIKLATSGLLTLGYMKAILQAEWP